jgi:hypothetical protein
MICEACGGTGRMMRDHLPVTGIFPGDPDGPPPGWSIWQPCRACGGCGIAHCCDGPVGGPDEVTNAR